MKMIRKVLLTAAFAATVAGALTGATFRGETKEVDLAATCAAAEWPQIPVGCLDGAKGEEIRYVSADNRIDLASMELRFSVAFQ